MNSRRKLVIALGASALTTPLCSFAQPQSGRTFRLGVLHAGTFASNETYFRAFFENLANLGYVEGKNLVVERRFADGRIDRLDVLAAELVAANVDIVYAPPAPAVLAAMKASSTVPIVFSMSVDPVGTGLVKSLARPGGNATGLSTLGSGLVPKRIELIHELMPHARAVGLLYDSREPSAKISRDSAAGAAKLLSLSIVEQNVNLREQLPAAFAALKKNGAQMLLVLEGSLGFINRDLVLSLAAANRLPALYVYPELPVEGGLMSYSVNFVEQYQRAAVFVAKIFKGAKPADLPVEQPTKFELIVNMKTAKALGITVPHAILLRADRVIE
ncbi:MAG: ABC transporter substrate-binding protein [Burkholderiaceae bacterium]